MMRDRNDPFAEIEIYEETSQPATLGQKINPSARGGGLDPVREKFYEMRGFAPTNPNAWQDVKLFYKQGLFMEDFCDSYDNIAPLSMHAPTYQRLGYEQLRTYFTWRTKVWQGFFADIPISYVHLHMYELISGIGVGDAEHGLYKMLTLWNAYRARLPQLDDFLPTWLKDYHVFYRLPHSFAHFVEYYNLQKFYPISIFATVQPNILQAWLPHGSYDISKSKFYSGENKELMEKAFYQAVIAMEKICAQRGKQLLEMFYLISNPATWWPFEDAVFHHARLAIAQPDREVRLSDWETYVCNEGRWTTRKFTQYRHMRDLIGYLIKNLEKHLRTVTGFKGPFSITVTKFSAALNVLENLGMTLESISQLFEKIAQEVYLDKTRVVVNVDRMNLIKIREEADEVQEKLIVEEVQQTLAPSPVEMPPAPPAVVSDVSASSPWQNFKSLLSPTELDALKLALEDTQAAYNFIRENNIMPEILADSINEKAMDTIGDNILEEMQIYDEYKQEVLKL